MKVVLPGEIFDQGVYYRYYRGGIIGEAARVTAFSAGDELLTNRILKTLPKSKSNLVLKPVKEQQEEV